MTTYTASLTDTQVRAAADAIDTFINTRELERETEETLTEVMWKLIRIIDQDNASKGVTY